ncbi:helix-loop-helix DNA-binding domain-containing protein [Phthorimaea operculella]|nr:helix-loop-helix DNA-binding domain-containing protein [Phthorimaea operculella]
MRDHDAYQLRPRSARRREPRERRPPQPLSKYRRKTANARERSRMREINRAFETLRQAVPAAAITGAPVPCEKLTKITTLRLAMRYISALTAALRDDRPLDEPQPERWPSPMCSSSRNSPQSRTLRVLNSRRILYLPSTRSSRSLSVTTWTSWTGPLRDSGDV